MNVEINNNLISANIYKKETPTLNPAFDVTPREIYYKINNRKGICKPKKELINKLLSNKMKSTNIQIIEAYKRHLDLGLM